MRTLLLLCAVICLALAQGKGHGKGHGNPHGDREDDDPPPMNQFEEERGKGKGHGNPHGKGGGKQKGWGKHHDIFGELKGGFTEGGEPDKKSWRKQAKRFCKRFPGHPKCSGGHIPQFNEIGELTKDMSANIGKFLPRVPRLRLQDPLAGLDSRLVELTQDWKKSFKLKDEERGRIKGACKNWKCREQPPEAHEKKQQIIDKIFEFEQKITGEDHTDSIGLQMDRVQQIKTAMLEKANLTDTVVPIDDGVFDKDLLLTETQSNFILNVLDKADEGADPVPEIPDLDDDGVEDAATATGRARRASIFFEQNPTQKWPITAPIPYTFDESLDEQNKNDVRGAIQEIQQKTCIRFQFVANPTGSHIIYYKVDSPTFCGLSYVGKVDPANPVYLSFQCANSRGVAVHETMHALGVGHQHLRMDRDQFINVDWSNINPQQYDQFSVLDARVYTSYGVRYDYGSIMHYNAYTAAINIAKPTMIPRDNQQSSLNLLGQRAAMSATDVEILKKMYCQPNCADTNVYCGAWALKGLCQDPGHNIYMGTNCKKSCNLCATAG